MRIEDLSIRVIDKFKSLVFDTDSCIIWPFAKNNQGYGHQGMRVSGIFKIYRSNRLSFVIFKGPVSDELQVCHTCDNPSCINPKHLFLGSNAINTFDRHFKGRTKINSSASANTRRINSKLSDADVKEIRELRSSGMTLSQLSKDYRVCYSSIRDIVILKIRV